MVSVITFFVYLSTYYFTTIQNMQTDNERYKKMASLAQIGWWEVDLTAGYYLCSDYLSDLLGLDGDTISTSDFLNLIREDYRKQIAQEFRANSSIHKDFYEQTFPIHSKYGEVWLHTRLAFREKGTGVDGAVRRRCATIGRVSTTPAAAMPTATWSSPRLRRDRPKSWTPNSPRRATCVKSISKAPSITSVSSTTSTTSAP